MTGALREIDSLRSSSDIRMQMIWPKAFDCCFPPCLVRVEPARPIFWQLTRPEVASKILPVPGSVSNGVFQTDFLPRRSHRGWSADRTGMPEQLGDRARGGPLLPVGRGEQEQKQCAIGVVPGRRTRAFRAAHHDIAFDGTDAPFPRLAAPAQRYLKGRKLVRQHAQDRRSPCGLGLSGPPKVQHLQRVAQKFTNAEGAGGAIESYGGKACNRAKTI